jgi:hypothetical protein
MKHCLTRKFNFLTATTFFVCAAAVSSSYVIAQERDAPPYTGYRGVSIGMTVDEARQKLGSPREKADTQDFYVFSDNETAQIFYDGEKKVNALTVTYTGKLSEAPVPKAVFGDDAEVKPNGGIFKMVRYPKAGFWISYNKIIGDETVIMIAMKKI